MRAKRKVILNTTIQKVNKHKMRLVCEKRQVFILFPSQSDLRSTPLSTLAMLLISSLLSFPTHTPSLALSVSRMCARYFVCHYVFFLPYILCLHTLLITCYLRESCKPFSLYFYPTLACSK